MTDPTGAGARCSQRPAFDPYDDVLTGPHTGTGPTDAQHYHYPPPLEAHARAAAAQARPEMHAPARRKRTERKQTNAPVVPPDSVTGRSLTLVITIMCFLACLTAGAVYMINESAKAWLKDIASEVTVQVTPQENVDTEKTVADVKAFLEKRSGIARARPLALDDAAALLEPWLGQTDALNALPVPRLIAVELDRESAPDLDALKTDLAKEFPGATLDDHRRWQRQIRTVTRSFALGGLAILLLVAAATTAIIISATRSSMASNREIVEVLHFVGATDRFIAREFEKHFLRLGVRAGLVGALCAMAVFFSMTDRHGAAGRRRGHGRGGAAPDRHRRPRCYRATCSWASSSSSSRRSAC